MRAVATMYGVYGPGANATGSPPAVSTNGGSSASADTRKSTAPTPIPITQVFSNLRGSIMGAPLTWLFGLIGVLVLFKLIEEKRGTREEFQEIKIGLNNMVKIGLMAVVVIVVGKFIFTRYDVPGLSSLFKAA